MKQSNFILSWLHSGNHYQPVDHENVEKCDKKTFGLCSGRVLDAFKARSLIGLPGQPISVHLKTPLRNLKGGSMSSTSYTRVIFIPLPGGCLQQLFK